MLNEPTSVDECVYFTNRSVNEKGHVKAWVYREKCPKCGKSLMGKPHDPKTGKTKIRADFYICPVCNHQENKEEYEDKLTANIKYACPYCNCLSETQVPFKRKKVRIFDEIDMKKKTVDVIRFQCSKCGKNIDITKKMK